LNKIIGGVQDAKLGNRRPVQYQVTFKHVTRTAAVKACRANWLAYTQPANAEMQSNEPLEEATQSVLVIHYSNQTCHTYFNILIVPHYLKSGGCTSMISYIM